jgi:hypothetical protein
MKLRSKCDERQQNQSEWWNNRRCLGDERIAVGYSRMDERPDSRVDCANVLLDILDSAVASDYHNHHSTRIAHSSEGLAMICSHCKHDFKEFDWEFIRNEKPCPECGKYFDKVAKEMNKFDGEELCRYEETIYKPL